MTDLLAPDLVQSARAVDLVSLIGRSVKLKRRGAAFWGCCPFHAEKSPSFKVENARGAFHCFGCGAHGSAIDWVMKTENASFPDAVKRLTTGGWHEVAAHLWERPSYAPKPIEEGDGYKDALSIWDSAVLAKGTLAEQYLRARGIRLPVSDQIRFARRLKHGPSKLSFPAMLGRISDDNGFCAVQRTFLQADKPVKINVKDAKGDPLPAKMTKGPMGGGAVRLRMPSGDTLGLAEGIETALSASQLYGMPVWATLSAHRLDKISIPENVRFLHLFGDPGEVGREQAFKAADHYEAQGRHVEIYFPEAHFRAGDKADFNDVIRGGVSRT